MDISDEYVNMCKEAKEIQNKWMPAVPDYVSLNGVNDPRDGSKWNEITTLVLNGDAGYYGYEPNDVKKEPTSFIWLLRQDQLIKLAKEFGIIKTWDVFYHVLDNVYSKCESPERAGLKYIMASQFGKIWNGKKWIKE